MAKEQHRKEGNREPTAVKYRSRKEVAERWNISGGTTYEEMTMMMS